MQKQVFTNRSEETEAIAAKIGHKLKGGEVIELSSDLGGGKTTFTRGIAHGAGSEDAVASPTFTISRQYETPEVRIYHFDFYRLQEAGLIAHELQDALADPKGVVVVEWSDVVGHVLPENRLQICIKSTGEESRELEIDCSERLAYLVEDL